MLNGPSSSPKMFKALLLWSGTRSSAETSEPLEDPPAFLSLVSPLICPARRSESSHHRRAGASSSSRGSGLAGLRKLLRRKLASWNAEPATDPLKLLLARSTSLDGVVLPRSAVRASCLNSELGRKSAASLCKEGVLNEVSVCSGRRGDKAASLKAGVVSDGDSDRHIDHGDGDPLCDKGVARADVLLKVADMGNSFRKCCRASCKG
mmetsp:Transcript_106853/g.207123  ORF Transcript_106853/g.207123 Transcript_106853/m.207123 type:complete len:207 (-) Transcript_106853:96-716(-)